MIRSLTIVALLTVSQPCTDTVQADVSVPHEPARVSTTESPSSTSSLSEPWASHLLTLGDADQPGSARWQAALGMAGGPAEAVAPLAALGESPELRYHVARALGELGRPGATEALSRWLSDRSWGARRYAALALGQIGGSDPAAGRALEAALDDLPHVREDALLALTRLEPEGGGPSLERFWTAGPSTGLQLDVTAPSWELRSDSPLELSVRLTNRTDHVLVLPPLARVLTRGLYLSDAEGRSAYPRDISENKRQASDLEEVQLAPGASTEARLRVELVPWDSGIAVDHEWRPAPSTRALAIGSVRYILHGTDLRSSTAWSARLVWHPTFVSDLVAQAARKDVFWTGKAVSDPFALTLVPQEP